jgi:uracil-DNA glycosylase family 4
MPDLGKWERQIIECQDCDLCKTSHKVIGDENPNAKLLIIGEAPGGEEEAQGIPFVGKAGKDLRKAMKEAGLLPDEYYVTNVLHCRPWEAGKMGGRVNRTPNKAEIAACSPHLVALLDLLKPKVVLAVGAVATSAVRPLLNESTHLVSVVHPAARYRMSAGSSELAWFSLVAGIKSARKLVRLYISDEPGFITNGPVKQIEVLPIITETEGEENDQDY